MLIKKSLLLCLLLLLCGCLSTAEINERRMANINKQLALTQELAIIKNKADHGDKAAQSFLKAIDLMPVHPDQGFPLMKQAAEGNIRIAQTMTALCYIEDKIVPRDVDQAVFWYKKAAAQGQVDAENNLGILYYFGKGVPQDKKLAKFWIEKAAAQHDTLAMRNLRNYQWN